MAWPNLLECILREFCEAQALVERFDATDAGGLEALRQAYRERQDDRGLCRSWVAESGGKAKLDTFTSAPRWSSNLDLFYRAEIFYKT